MMITPDTQVDDKTLAALVGVSARMIRGYVTAGILERVGPGRYELGPSIRALVDHASGTASELQKARIRRLEAQAVLAEIAAARARDEVAPIEEIQRVWIKTLAIIKQRMRQIPVRVESRIIGETDSVRLKKSLLEEIDQALVAAVDEIGQNDFSEDDQE